MQLCTRANAWLGDEGNVSRGVVHSAAGTHREAGVRWTGADVLELRASLASACNAFCSHSNPRPLVCPSHCAHPSSSASRARPPFHLHQYSTTDRTAQMDHGSSSTAHPTVRRLTFQGDCVHLHRRTLIANRTRRPALSNTYLWIAEAGATARRALGVRRSSCEGEQMVCRHLKDTAHKWSVTGAQ